MGLTLMDPKPLAIPTIGTMSVGNIGVIASGYADRSGDVIYKVSSDDAANLTRPGQTYSYEQSIWNYKVDIFPVGTELKFVVNNK